MAATYKQISSTEVKTIVPPTSNITTSYDEIPFPIRLASGTAAAAVDASSVWNEVEFDMLMFSKDMKEEYFNRGFLNHVDVYSVVKVFRTWTNTYDLPTDKEMTDDGSGDDVDD